jgi:poly-beta-1,6-N-acetyl-D-glucosamine synthase
MPSAAVTGHRSRQPGALCEHCEHIAPAKTRVWNPDSYRTYFSTTESIGQLAVVQVPGVSRYLVITPARDEEQFLPRLIDSVASQHQRPDRWIIIDDGSMDRTASIVDAAAITFPWIEPRHLPRLRDRAPGGESVIMQALPRDACQQYDHILRLDADLSFAADFCQLLLTEFGQDSQLGIAGPTLYEPTHSGWHEIRQPQFHTRGAAKLYSGACLASIGGLDGGLGWDTLDEAYAMMLGFRTRSFRHITAKHHRPQGAASGRQARMAAGLSAYKVGYSPLFMLARAARQSFSAPFSFGGLLLLTGYLKGYLQRQRRSAPPELVKFIRKHQLRRLLCRDSLWR